MLPLPFIFVLFNLFGMLIVILISKQVHHKAKNEQDSIRQILLILLGYIIIITPIFLYYSYIDYGNLSGGVIFIAFYFALVTILVNIAILKEM